MTSKEQEFLDAATGGDIEKVKASLKAGIDINVRDERGLPKNRTALMHAAENGHLAIVDLLIEAGAKVNAIDKGFPIDCPGGNTALILTIQKGHLKIAHHLLDAGASPKTKGGSTSVITAASYFGDGMLVKRLLELGADPMRRDGSGFNAIASAVNKGNAEVVKLLLDLGVDSNSPDPFGNPVLMSAVAGGNLEICRELVNRGADPNKGDSDGFTPLMKACAATQQQIVNFLVSLKVAVNKQDSRGRTALDIIKRSQEPPDFVPDVLERLIKLGGITITPPEKLEAIESMLRKAGAKTSKEL